MSLHNDSQGYSVEPEDLCKVAEGLLAEIRAAEEQALREEFAEHPPFAARPDGMEDLGVRMDRLALVPILARLQADREEIERFKRRLEQALDQWKEQTERAIKAEQRAEAAEARVKELERTVQSIIAPAEAGGGIVAELRAQVASLEKERDEAKAWKDAVIHACVVSWVNWEDGNPRKAINDLMCWEQKVALDPTVSKAAAELRAEGKREGIEEMRAEAVKLFDNLAPGEFSGWTPRSIQAGIRALLTESAGEGKGER